VKPKIESNIIVMVLFFLFPLCGSALNSILPDTLIIDGETIFIEKQEVTLDVDSLEEAQRNDVRYKPVRNSFLTVGLYGGMNFTSASYRTSSGNLVALDEFTDNTKSFQANFIPGFDVCAKVWSFPVGKKRIDAGVMAGLNFNKIKIASSVIQDETPFLEDSILKLRFVQGEVFLDYFREIQAPLFYELDTFNIDYRREITEYSTLDIPLALRFTLSSQNSAWQYFTEIGIAVRRIRSGGKAHDNYLVNDAGEMMVLRRSEFKAQHQLRPMFALGLEARLPKAEEQDLGFFTVGFKASASVPQSPLNAGSLFVMDFTSFATTLFLRRTF
jgi:hypothetical protein